MKIRKMMKRIGTALMAGAMMISQTVSAFAEEPAPLPYADTVLPSGLTVAQFADTMNELGREDNTYASAEIGIFRGDETIYTGYFGKVNYEDDIPADEESVYEWGSISKTLIWVSVMQLWEQGRIDLDRDVREYLPEGFFQHLKYDEPITMMNLMNHNAGWQETTRPVFAADAAQVKPLCEALKELEPAQVNRPGEVVAYSNYGAAVAGYVVEQITGMDYCEYVHENIFKPLGMEHTALNPTHSDNPWVMQQRENSRSYAANSSFETLIDYGSKIEYVSAYPAGAATGTLADLMTYAQAFVDDSAPLFASPATQDKLFEGTSFYGDSDIPTCAHGFFFEEHAVRTCGHSGGTHFGQANMLFDRESKTGMVVMVNERTGNAFLSLSPFYCFGELSPDKYAAEGASLEVGDRTYLYSRAWHEGMIKFYTYLNAGNLRGTAKSCGSSVYEITGQGLLGGEAATLIGVTTDSRGRRHIQQPSIEAVSDGGFLAKLALLTVYAMTAVAAAYMLLIRRKLKKARRPGAAAVGGAMTAAHLARLISVALLFAAFIVFATFGSISLPAAAVIGVLQAVCLGVCGTGAVWALISLCRKKERSRPWLYIAHAAGNVLCCAAIVFFEMYRFLNT